MSIVTFVLSKIGDSFRFYTRGTIYYFQRPTLITAHASAAARENAKIIESFVITSIYMPHCHLGGMFLYPFQEIFILCQSRFFAAEQCILGVILRLLREQDRTLHVLRRIADFGLNHASLALFAKPVHFWEVFRCPLWTLPGF